MSFSRGGLAKSNKLLIFWPSIHLSMFQYAYKGRVPLERLGAASGLIHSSHEAVYKLVQTPLYVFVQWPHLKAWKIPPISQPCWLVGGWT